MNLVIAWNENSNHSMEIRTIPDVTESKQMQVLLAHFRENIPHCLAYPSCEWISTLASIILQIPWSPSNHIKDISSKAHKQVGLLLSVSF